MKAAATPIYVVAYDLARWLTEHVERLPRADRGAVIVQAQGGLALEVVGAVSVAVSFRRRRLHHLQHANEALARLRVSARLARDTRGLSDAQADHVLRLVDEVGQMIGGWERKLDARGAGVQREG